MEWIIDILKLYGLAGVVMFALAVTVRQQQKSAFEVNNHRLAERDVLIKALEANTTAIKENAKVTEQRNQATQDLAEAISKQAGAFDIFLQKTEFNQTTMKDTLQTHAKALEAFSESNRVNSGILRDVRDYIERQHE